MKQDKMKAIVLKGFGGNWHFEFTENITLPGFGPEEVLVKIEAWVLMGLMWGISWLQQLSLALKSSKLNF